MAPMSLRPSEASEGGAFPRGYLTVTAAKFGEYHYMTKDPQGNPTPALDENKKAIVSMAAIITLENETGDVLAVVDARPSDAIALALRAHCGIRVAESVMRRAGEENGESETEL